MSCRLDRLVKDPKEGNAWHADHFVPVYQGGGMYYFLEDFQEFALPTNICTTDFPNQLSDDLNYTNS